MENPKVSIVIPVYNGANFVAEAIESALNQTYKNTEIIVVNDGSIDNGATDRAVTPYLSRIKYVKKENGGISSALNTGIKNMTGEYFSWLSHDDIYAPNKIEEQVKNLQSHMDIALCTGGLVDIKRNPIPHFVKGTDGRFPGVEMLYKFLSDYELNGLAFLIPKNIFLKFGLFDEEMSYLQDLDMWLRILMNDVTVVCQSQKLVFTRIHALQTTNTKSDHFDIDREKLIVKHINIIDTADFDEERILDLLQFYYLLAVKGKNKPGKAAAYSALKRHNANMAYLKRKALPYIMRGYAKTIMRHVYHFVLKLKGARN